MGRRKKDDQQVTAVLDTTDGLTAADTEGSIAVWTQRARAWGLLLGFGIGFGMAYQAGIPVVDAALRGILAAFVMSLLAWWCTLMVIQGLIRTALVRRNEERQKAYDEIIAAREAAAAAKAAEEAAADEEAGAYYDDQGGNP